MPSDVSKASFVVGPRSALTSHFLACEVCCARGDEQGQRDQERQAEADSFHSFLFVGFVFEAAPQVPARDGAIGPPGFPDLADAIGCGLLPQLDRAL